MSEFVRLGQYTTLLGGKQGKTRDEIMAALEISAATFKRDIAKLRYRQRRTRRHSQLILVGKRYHPCAN